MGLERIYERHVENKDSNALNNEQRIREYTKNIIWIKIILKF